MTEYKTPNDLIHFIIWECGGMLYDRRYGNNCYDLIIQSNLQMKQVYYLNVLMWERFNMYLDKLEIHCEVSDDIDELTNLGPFFSSLSIYSDCDIKLPELPKSLNKIMVYDDCTFSDELNNSSEWRSVTAIIDPTNFRRVRKFVRN